MRNNKVTVAIPARNEKYLIQTCKNFIDKAYDKENLEIIVVLDGFDQDYKHYKDEFIKWKRTCKHVKFIDHEEPKGVRVAANEVAAVATGFYFMKMDSHCDITQDWDLSCKNAVDAFGWNTMLIPDMVSYNPDNGDWGERRMNHCYLRPDCTKTYWHDFDYGKCKDKVEQLCPELKGIDTSKFEPMLCNVGAAWFCRTDFLWLFDGQDEDAYIWGESGSEISLKTWLSGGKQLLIKDVCFAHYFRKKFPYKINGNQVILNKQNSKNRYAIREWTAKTRTFNQLIDAFSPVPEWEIK